jgi:branched-subunit amino acid aminotransferase/4-amino-4-deoxychorismate lyase
LARRPLSRSWVWLGGRIVPAERARVSVWDRGLLYGDAVFETVRFYDARPFQWERHRRRLAASLARFAIPASTAGLRDAALALLARSRLRDAAVRITVTRGAAEGLLPPPRLEPMVLISARAIPAALTAQRRDGIRAVALPFGRGVGGLTRGHKATDYLAAVCGRLAAQRRRAEDGVFVEVDGSVSEATASNVFVVEGRRLATPPLDAGCLPGVTRALVIAEAERAGLRVRTERISPDRLRAADEIFLTASVIEVLPVVRLDGRRVGDGRVGAVTRTLQERYERLVARSLAARHTADPARRRARAPD